MENPFIILEKKLNHLTELVLDLSGKVNGASIDEKPLNADEASKYLDLSKQTLYHLTSKRKIPHIKPGQKVYFFKADLDKWLQEHRQKTVKEIEEEM